MPAARTSEAPSPVAAASRPERPSPAPRAGWREHLVRLPAVLFAVPVLGGMAVSAARLLATPDPDVGFSSVVNADAGALYLGQPLYQDPAEGYPGMLYTPGLPALVSVLFRIDTWRGWPALVAILAALAMVAVVARLAYRRSAGGRGARALAVAEAAGVGSLALALYTCIGFNGVFGGAGVHDAVAWVPAMVGLVLLPRAASGSRRAAVAVVVLLSVAFWTKQNTVLAAASGAAWLALAAVLRAAPWRRVAGVCAGLLGLNLALMGALNLASSGWEFYFNVVVPRRHPVGDLGDAGFPRNLPDFLLGDFLPATLLAGAFAGGLWLVLGAAALVRRRARAASSAERGSAGTEQSWRAGMLAEARAWRVLALPLILVLVVAVWLRRSGNLHLYVLTTPAERVEKLVEGVVTPAVVLSVVMAVSLGLVLAARRVRRGGLSRLGARLAGASSEIQVATVLASFLVLAFVPIFWLRQKIGADDHYYDGVAWALVLLSAIAYRRARARPGTGVVAAVGVAGLLAVTAAVSPTAPAGDVPSGLAFPSLAPIAADNEDERWLNVLFPSHGLVPVRRWSTATAEPLRSYGRDRLVYDQSRGDRNLDSRGQVWPGYDNFSGLLGAGRQPEHFVNALLARRFDAVLGPFATDDRKEFFSAQGGRGEENYLWKMNRVLAAGYAPAPGAPAGVLVRRPGPNRAAPLGACFAPFRLAGAPWFIGDGGGLWCRESGRASIRLRETPDRDSEIRTGALARAPAGSLGVTLPRGRGSFQVTIDPRPGAPLRLRGRVGPRRSIDLTLLRGPELVDRVTLAPGRRPVRASARVALSTRPGAAPGMRRSGDRDLALELGAMGPGAMMRLAGSREGHAEFDLARLTLR